MTDIEKGLLKKWRGLLTKYTNLQNNNWIKVRKRGLTTITTDCSANKDFYMKEIEKANKIIFKLQND